MATHFGEWLRAKRGRKGDPGFITQEDLANRMGVTRSYVVQIEGRPDVPTYPTRQRIHAALGTTEEELIALGIVRGGTLRVQPATAVAAAGDVRLAVDNAGTADAFIASLTGEQRRMLRDLLDAMDRIEHIDDARPELDSDQDRRRGAS